MAHTRSQASSEVQRAAEERLAAVKDPGAIVVQLNSAGEEVFVKGVGVHLWQSSGDKDSNWTHILRSWHPLNFLRFALARLQGGPTVLEVCPNSWDRYDEDAELAQSIGCNGFRLGLEWSRLQPRRGKEWDAAAVQRFHDIFDSLLARGITPNVTLSHFTLPQWFQEDGGFAEAANIPVFVEYAIKAVRVFGGKIKLWATFNEPVSTSTMGWVFGAYPPGVIGAFETSGQVLLNMLRAHTAAYAAIKALPGGASYKVGLTHMFLPFSHWPDLGPFSLHSKMFAQYMDLFWGYDIVHNYLLTGRFTWHVPSTTSLTGTRCVLDVQDERPPLDWFGVNYYSRPVIGLTGGPGRRPWQVLSDLKYPIDPEGLAQSLARASAYRVPLYVTETGVSIASPKERAFAIDAYVKEILKALRDGIDVRGVFHWTLLDNFEWNAGYSIKFGLFEWSPWPWGRDRAKRPAADTLAAHYQGLPDTLAGVKTAVQDMNLRHRLVAPPPSSVRWWVGTALLLVLGLYGVLIRGGMRACFALLRAVWPAAAAQLAAWQAAAAHLPWKHAAGGDGADGAGAGEAGIVRQSVKRINALATARAADNGNTQQPQPQQLDGRGGGGGGAGSGSVRHKKKKQPQQQQPAHAT